MATDAYFQILAGLLIVLGLIVLGAAAIRRYGLLPGAATVKPRHLRRLRVEETLTLDTRRRLILLRHDDQEHLVLLAPGCDVLLSSSHAEPRQ